MLRPLRNLVLLAATLLLSACASVQPDAYRDEKPILELDRYFNGTVDAWGMFQDRSGKVIKRFHRGTARYLDRRHRRTR